MLLVEAEAEALGNEKGIARFPGEAPRLSPSYAREVFRCRHGDNDLGDRADSDVHAEVLMDQ
jgi:hypothetical protein